MHDDTTVTLDMPCGLTVTATLDPQSPIVEQFYRGYERAFVLPNEREELDGFRNCLALNLPPQVESLTRRYGPFREVVLIAKDGRDGQMIGGANFIAFPPPPKMPDGSVPAATINLNYVFVVETARRRGYLSRLVDSVTPTARVILGLDTSMPVLTFIEQNDPLRMSVEDYVEDTRLTGLDQVDRIGIWARLGARVVDFPYVQPPLSADHKPEESLVYSVLGAPSGTLSACQLEHHLRRFFAISVFKGGNPDEEPSAGAQLSALTAMCRMTKSIALLDPRTWIARDGIAIRGKGRELASPPSLREALRA
jgi:hypothetical protein